MKQRVTLHGPIEDATLPAPYVFNTREKFEVVAEEGTDDLLECDVLPNENALRFKKTKAVEVMMALDPDTGSHDDANEAAQTFEIPIQTNVDGALQVDNRLPQFGDETNTDFAPIESDVEEAAHVGDQPTAAESREIVSDSRAPPAG